MVIYPESGSFGRGSLSAVLKNILILAVLLGLGFLYFQVALDNGFWHSDDFNYLVPQPPHDGDEGRPLRQR